MNIQTTCDHPPIPFRGWDWSAIDGDTFDGDPDSSPRSRIVGRGTTEAEAIADLIEQTEDLK